MSYPRAFFDIDICGFTSGRVIMELYDDTAPLTVENFLALCTGECGTGSSGTPLHYKYSSIRRVIPGFTCLGGDFDGKGGESIYGKEFKAENFIRKHTGPGILSMVDIGNGTNGSQFSICFEKAPDLDGKQVVFGKVVSGMDVIKEVEKHGMYPITISDCGKVSSDPKISFCVSSDCVPIHNTHRSHSAHTPSHNPTGDRDAPKPKTKMSYPRAFFDIDISGFTSGRVIMELYDDTAPLTVENFLALCTGECGTGSCGIPLHYKYSSISRVIPGFTCLCGDFDGKGGESIYGKEFKAENFIRKHTGPGILSMVDIGNGTNGSQFSICFEKAPDLDGKQVVFGKVVSGMDVIKEVEKYGMYPITISDCGKVSSDRKISVRWEQLALN